MGQQGLVKMCSIEYRGQSICTFRKIIHIVQPGLKEITLSLGSTQTKNIGIFAMIVVILCEYVHIFGVRVNEYQMPRLILMGRIKIRSCGPLSTIYIVVLWNHGQFAARGSSCKNGLSAPHPDLRDFQTNVACTALYGSQSWTLRWVINQDKVQTHTIHNTHLRSQMEGSKRVGRLVVGKTRTRPPGYPGLFSFSNQNPLFQTHTLMHIH